LPSLLFFDLEEKLGEHIAVPLIFFQFDVGMNYLAYLNVSLRSPPCSRMHVIVNQHIHEQTYRKTTKLRQMRKLIAFPLIFLDLEEKIYGRTYCRHPYIFSIIVGMNYLSCLNVSLRSPPCSKMHVIMNQHIHEQT
jgi:hypothetical protein